jgi:hypothetical protein
MDGTPFENMEWHQKSRFKTADDQKSYEADYSERAKQHRDEELDYVNESQNSILFESVQYGVLIAGFRHSYQKDGKVGLTGRKIKDTAMAGYCGQLYATELVAWWQEPRVEMIIKAFREIEVSCCALQCRPLLNTLQYQSRLKPHSQCISKPFLTRSADNPNPPRHGRLFIQKACEACEYLACFEPYSAHRPSQEAECRARR